MNDGPVSVELKYGVSAFFVTCGIDLMGVSAINPTTFTPGITLLSLAIRGFIPQRLVYELTEMTFHDDDNVGRALSALRMILMVAAAVIGFLLCRPFLPL